MSIERARLCFVADSRCLLDEMEATLLNVDTGNPAKIPTSTTGALFRLNRDIKLAAGALSLHGIASFTNVVEGVLDYVHHRGIALTVPLVALLLECSDHIRRLVEAVGNGDARRAADPGTDLIEQLRLHLKHSQGTHPGRTPGPRRWHISFQCGRDMLRRGTDPLSIFHYLRTLGTIEHMATAADAVPALADLDPQACYLGFSLTFSSMASLASIEDAFEFIQDDDSLHMVGAQAPLICPSSLHRVQRSHLPRHAATIDGFQTTVGDTVLVMPMDAIDECVSCTAEASASHVAHRGKVLPVLRLRDHFGITCGGNEKENLVIISHAGEHFGLVVDALLGDAQTAVAPVPAPFAAIPGIAALSILCNGDLALVLDLDALGAAAKQVQARTTATRH
jgi:chemotaxis protein histidine kinase CheA